jgi:hypothetical protein
MEQLGLYRIAFFPENLGENSAAAQPGLYQARWPGQQCKWLAQQAAQPILFGFCLALHDLPVVQNLTWNLAASIEQQHQYQVCCSPTAFLSACSTPL